MPKLSVKEKLILKPKKEKFSFKNVELSDIEKIVLIEADCHISPWSKKNFLDSISAGNLFQVLKEDELIIGYYIASFAADECELLNITVNKHFHKQGFGKIIIKNNQKDIWIKVLNFLKQPIAEDVSEMSLDELIGHAIKNWTMENISPLQSIDIS